MWSSIEKDSVHQHSTRACLLSCDRAFQSLSMTVSGRETAACTWHAHPGKCVQVAELLAAKELGRMYYVEYTVQKAQEAKRHLLSLVALGNNGRHGPVLWGFMTLAAWIIRKGSLLPNQSCDASAQQLVILAL